MKRVRKGRTMAVMLATVAALSCVLAATIFAASYGTTVTAGNLVIHLKAALSPNALPKNKMAPIDFHASASVETVDGSHVPPAQAVHLQVDKHFRIDTTGLPVCPPQKIQATTPTQAMRSCGDALVGKGYASAQVEFPESLPFTAKGPLLAFNGPASGGGYGGASYNEQLYYIYVSVPAPTAVIVVAKLSKDTGKYGYRVSVTVPEIAGGSGSVTNVEFKIDRKWSYKGQEHSYLNADCPTGHFFNQIEVAYGNGTDLTGSIVNSCKSKG
jgi:hypothetical protein